MKEAGDLLKWQANTFNFVSGHHCLSLQPCLPIKPWNSIIPLPNQPLHMCLFHHIPAHCIAPILPLAHHSTCVYLCNMCICLEQPLLLDCSDSECWESKLLCIIPNYLPIDTASYPTTAKHSSVLPPESKILQSLSCVWTENMFVAQVHTIKVPHDISTHQWNVHKIIIKSKQTRDS